MSRAHLARLVHAYLQLPGAQPGGRSPDNAFTLLSPVDGHCVAVDWCPIDDAALICAHPFEGRASDHNVVVAGADEEGQEVVLELGRDQSGHWLLHEDLITGRTTLALLAPVTAWTRDDFSHAFEAFCRRLTSMSVDADADALDGAPAIERPRASETVEHPVGMFLLQRA